MKTVFFSAAALAAGFGATAAQAETTTYNTAPTDGWHYGSGNDYTPANTVVLTTDAGNELYLRFHETFHSAPLSAGHVYSFPLGSFVQDVDDPVGQPGQLSFDWGFDGGDSGVDLIGVTANFTLTNLGTGVSLNAPFPFQPDNEFLNGSVQNSFRLNWVNGIPGYSGFFDPNVDGLYRVQLDVFGLDGVDSSHSLYADAQLGAGVAAVPEPATWAMMLLGMGLVGGVMRRKAKTAVRVRYA